MKNSDTNKGSFIHRCNMGLMKKLAAIIGLALIAVSVANVEFGAIMGLEPPQKLILARLADPGCNADEIQKDLDAGDANDCVTTPGVWEAPDLLLLLEGSIMFLTTFIRWPRKGRWALRIRKMAVVAGVILCGIALADRFDQLPGTSSEDLAALLPFPAPPVAVQIGIFAAGIFLIRGPKYRIDNKASKEARSPRKEYTIQQLDMAYQQGGNLGNLGKTKRSKGSSQYKTIGDLWNYQGLSQYEDAFESGMRDTFSDSVGRTCHLCNGEGCNGCSNTGMVS